MSPGLNLTDKENLSSAMGNLSVKDKSAVDLTKCQKGAQPGGIGKFPYTDYANFHNDFQAISQSCPFSIGMLVKLLRNREGGLSRL